MKISENKKLEKAAKNRKLMKILESGAKSVFRQKLTFFGEILARERSHDLRLEISHLSA